MKKHLITIFIFLFCFIFAGIGASQSSAQPAMKFKLSAQSVIDNYKGLTFNEQDAVSQNIKAVTNIDNEIPNNTHLHSALCKGWKSYAELEKWDYSILSQDEPPNFRDIKFNLHPRAP